MDLERCVVLALTGVMTSACEPMLASTPQPEQMGTTGSAKPRGWIESKREIALLDVDARAPASFEYTVRDGLNPLDRTDRTVK
jgi:hypothetical protein